MSYMINLQIARNEDRTLLWNINQKYLYEMTQYYDDPMDENGNFHYGHFEEYFSDPNRTAYLLYDDDNLVGFALLNPYSCCRGKPDYTMAEFTIFPACRRRYLASEAVKTVLEKHPGKWEIKYNEKNSAAKEFWNKITSGYSPEKTRLNEEETVLSFEAAI